MYWIGTFYTRFASEIESDPVGDYTRAKAALQMLDIDPDTVTTEDLSSLRYVCEVVSRRASFMASAGITALLKKMDYKDVTIAIDGSLFRYFDIDSYEVLQIVNKVVGINHDVTSQHVCFRYHPHFKNVMQSRISQLMGIDYKFDLMLSEDGSGRGAALVAATLKNEKQI